MIILEKDKNDILKRDNIPLPQLITFMQGSSTMPYEVEFSFKPYLKKLESCIPNTCDTTQSILSPLLEGMENAMAKDPEMLDQMLDSKEFKSLMSFALPSLFFENDLAFITPPLTKNFLLKTKAFDDLVSNEKNLCKIDKNKVLDFNKEFKIAVICILNNFYNTNLSTKNNDVIVLQNSENGIVKHYQIQIRIDYVDIIAKETPPELNQAEIDFILRNIDDKELILKYFPADNYVFSGFVVGNFIDISEIGLLSEMKLWLTENETNFNPSTFINTLNEQLVSYLEETSIKVGLILFEFGKLYKTALSLSGLGTVELADTNQGGVYHKVLTNKEIVFIEDLTRLKSPSRLERKLLRKGIKSILLYPILDEHGEISTLFEFGSTKKSTLNYFAVRKLAPIFELLKDGYKKSLDVIENEITGIIQHNFTSIHESVAWKFEEIALAYHVDKMNDREDISFGDIVFKDVIPLYAQADIVSSSTQRNLSIKLDLIKNLELLDKLLAQWSEKKNIHVLESYQIKIKDFIETLETSYVSNDESTIVSFITNEVHPILKIYLERYKLLFNKDYFSYTKMLNSDLGIVYEKRKAFENSVTILNNKISNFLEEDDRNMQSTLPHFFEKYKTDGIEYNIYIGQSILKEGQFYKSDISNFRLWQLVNTCEITKLVAELTPNLEVPLTTAQLIFAFNQSLSIRFRLDEKKFDVDGAYNVRFEILKKRIDKAIVKGTKERLTLSGKVAIVYLGENERREYIGYFDYLKSKGYTDGSFEDLELEKLDGAEGLKALRITIN